MTTFDTKAAHIQAIRNGDLEAIKEWFDCRPQNEYAVEKLAAKVLLEKLGQHKKLEPMSKEDLVSRLLVCESALRVIHHTLKVHRLGQAVVVLARNGVMPTSEATAFIDEDIEMLMGIADMAVTMESDKVVEFLQDLQISVERAAECEERTYKPPRKKRKPPTPPSF